MTNHPRGTIVADAKRTAIAAGWSIREGAYVGIAGNQCGRWYPVRTGETGPQTCGSSHATHGDAWIAAAEEAACDAVVSTAD